MGSRCLSHTMRTQNPTIEQTSGALPSYTCQMMIISFLGRIFEWQAQRSRKENRFVSIHSISLLNMIATLEKVHGKVGHTDGIICKWNYEGSYVKNRKSYNRFDTNWLNWNYIEIAFCQIASHFVILLLLSSPLFLEYTSYDMSPSPCQLKNTQSDVLIVETSIYQKFPRECWV